MAVQSPWDDQEATLARTGRAAGANPYGPPAVKAAPEGKPAAPAAGANSAWQGYNPGYLGQTGGAQPGSGWGYYYANNGRPTAAGALGGLAKNFNYEETPQSELSVSGMGRAKGLIDSGDPDKLADKFYRKGESVALRAGQAAREQQLADSADTYASRGMLRGGGANAARADINRQASQARLSALDQLGSQAMQFGEQAAVGRLGAGMPWENSDLSRRSDNTQWKNRAIDKRTDLAASAASAAAGGYERILEIPGFGEVPESMLPYIGDFMGGL